MNTLTIYYSDKPSITIPIVVSLPTVIRLLGEMIDNGEVIGYVIS